MTWEERWPDRFGECIGCDCPPGWADVVEKTLVQLVEIPELKIIQIKEKFGGLRLYISNPDGPEEDWRKAAWHVEQAEYVCWFVCQDCGTTKDVSTSGGWRRTLCSGCRDKRTCI